MSRFPFPALPIPRLPQFPPLLRALCVLAAWLGLAGAGHAANAKFDGDAVPYCSNPSGPAYDSASRTYTCDPLPANVDVTIASGYTLVIRSSMTFDYHQFLKMEGTARLYVKGDLNIGNIQPSHVMVDGGNLVADGRFSMGAQAQEITANVTAATIDIGTGSASRVNGSLTASGPVTLASNVKVVGNVAGTVVRLAASQTEVVGDITATTSLKIESGNKVTGTITSGNMTMDPSGVVVNGSVNVTGNLSMGSGDTINGNVVVSGSVLLQAANAYISGNLSANAVTLNSGGRVGQYITCTGPQSSTTPCSCVTNNSGYPFNSTNGPKCTAPAASAPHHLLIEHPSTALTCQPVTVQVTACANAACTSNFTGGMNVTLNPGGQTFAIGASGKNSAATVHVTSTAQVTLSAIPSVTASAPTVCSKPDAPTNDCKMTGKEAGLELSVPHHIAETRQTLKIQALAAAPNNQSCVPLFKGDKSINFSCKYKNPASGTVPLRLGDNVQDALAADANTACSAAGTYLTLKFKDDGSAETGLIYADAGDMTLNATHNTTVNNAAVVVSGSANFIAAPDRFVFEIAKASDATVKNPAPADGNGAAFLKAGENFTGILKAVNKAGNVTKNFGKESTPQSYTITQALVAPDPISNPAASNAAVSGNFNALVNGVSPAATMSWNDVGIFSFKAELSNLNGYLGAGASQFITAGKVNVGRFIPDHFETALTGRSKLPDNTMLVEAAPMSCAGTPLVCPAFPYYLFSGQKAELRVTAYKAGNAGVATNYSEASKLSRAAAVSAWGPLTIVAGVEQSGAANPGGGSMDATTAVILKDSFVGGVGTGVIQYGWPLSALVAPTNVYFRATSEGVSSLRSSGTVEGGLAVVSGRLLVVNNYGSEHYSMPVTVRAQYWNGAAGYLDSTFGGLDGATISVPKLNFTACQKGLLKADGSCVTINQLNNTPLTFQAGRATFQLAKPGVAGSTNLDLRDTAPFMRPAAGKLTFGVYNSGPVLYLREVY